MMSVWEKIICHGKSTHATLMLAVHLPTLGDFEYADI